MILYKQRLCMYKDTFEGAAPQTPQKTPGRRQLTSDRGSGLQHVPGAAGRPGDVSGLRGRCARCGPVISLGMIQGTTFGDNPARRQCGRDPTHGHSLTGASRTAARPARIAPLPSDRSEAGTDRPRALRASRRTPGPQAPRTVRPVISLSSTQGAAVSNSRNQTEKTSTVLRAILSSRGKIGVLKGKNNVFTEKQR